ncbi:MAG: hypothetical protein ACETVN_01460 [Asgard group archaeon]
MSENSECFSWIEKIVNRGPFPNARSSIFFRVLNIFIISCILPIIGYLYTLYFGIDLLNPTLIPQRYSIEIIITFIGLFLFSYSYLLYLASQRVKKYFDKIRDAIDYENEEFQNFKNEILCKIFNPPLLLLILLIITVPLGFSEVVSNPIYTGDAIVSVLLGIILIYSTVLNWSASWMLFIFLRTSKEFGTEIPLRINPFDPDRIGGLAPLSALSTFAIFAVGLLSTIVIPLWYVFSSQFYLIWVFVSSFLIPVYFFYSMGGVYKTLTKEKQDSLRELNDELQHTSSQIREFIKADHKNKLDETKLERLGQTLNSINIIYERINSMHTFPVNSEIMIKITLSAVLPIIGILVDVLSSFIINPI